MEIFAERSHLGPIGGIGLKLNCMMDNQYTENTFLFLTIPDR